MTLIRQFEVIMYRISPDQLHEMPMVKVRSREIAL